MIEFLGFGLVGLKFSGVALQSQGQNGVIWTVKKDITRYSSLLLTNQTLAVYIGNIVNSKYTGVYHVEIFVHFYPTEKVRNPFKGFDSVADLIAPVSRNLPLNDGLLV